ncbi:ABC transporter permease [Clostridium sp. CF011]|uniref:ABC transporter permease n=1 Tax=Clostridium sp. CF011 TaxID=2843318 RepID=UPI001C0AE17C|nr:ABC transporter permease [Clostridium sp. CF011]MBU3092529.1 ABC transporter permease [Clostridium sp. CF011]WAG68782.1 ABC transporter permease [Clostridium sp. CF011]
MYIFKNALKNISRNLGRNILIGIIALVIAVSSCVALSIKQAAKTAQNEGLKDLSITATIGVDMTKIQEQAKNDRQALRQLMQNNPAITLAEMQKYSNSSYVKDFNYSLESSISKSDGIEPYTETETTTTGDTNGFKVVTSDKKDFGGMGQQGDFTIRGYNTENAMTSFVNGTNKIASGGIFSFDKADNSCLISDTLSTFNNLKVGDKIKLSNPNLSTETYELTIKGIYSTTATSDNKMMRFSASQDPANYIYTNYNTLKAITNNSENKAQKSTDQNENETTTALRYQTSGIYSFSNIEQFNNFKTDVVSLGLSKDYTVTSEDVTNYEQSLVPLKNLNKFADIFLLLVFIIGGTILVVLNIFNIRERKYEVGVLTAIGMKKIKVAFQFVIELFLVTFVAIIIGTSIGAIASVPIANTLLESQVTSAQTQQSTQNENFGRPGMGQAGGSVQIRNSSKNNDVSYIKNITAVTDINVILQLIGIGILLTIISSCGATIFILRYEPLKILSNRN